jgi:hypothetical protein
MPFSRFDKQGMKFIIDARVPLKPPVDELLRFTIPDVLGQHAVPRQNPPGVSVGNENRPVAGIEQDGIDSFGPETAQLKQRGTQLLGRPFKHSSQGAFIVFFEPADERDDGASLLPEEARGSDERSKLALLDPAQISQIEEAGLAKLSNRQRRVPPGRILGQDRPENHLQATSAGPPALWSVFCEQSLVVRVQIASLGPDEPLRDCITLIRTAGCLALSRPLRSNWGADAALARWL